MVLRPQFFKSLRPPKTKTALAKTKTSKNSLKIGLKTKTGLKDYTSLCQPKINRNVAKRKVGVKARKKRKQN